ncbi:MULTISPECIES: MurR/RpiR family transcriptional regulator [unclassified Diaminobutyricimonas]|uniref:MurR/RpiR family transcriptional regulator n=1 Tax=unclassified Diaminobutyricimonas TaxID=2643261 RepID=UPI001E3503BD|nr:MULTISPECIES: MurR/RpiR family transcriptional regulator [unclassified Diaminobutyricimonas]
MSSSTLTTLHQRLPELTPTEQRIGAYVLADPAAVAGASITQVAAGCDVSVASLARFARTLGFQGYAEFRLAVAVDADRATAGRERFQVGDGEVGPLDDAETTVRKIAYEESSAIDQTARDLDLVALDTLAERISNARRIDIYGFASSALSGMDLQQKLHRIGLFSQCWSDHHLALTSAALLTDADVAIGISHSGRTIEILQTMEVAAGTGAMTAAITNVPTSPLATRVDLVLTTSASDTPFRSGAMSSRIAQLTVIDFLLVRIAQRNYDRMATNLELTYKAVQGHRVD